MNTFSLVVESLGVTDRDRCASPMQRTGSILLTARMVPQRRPRGIGVRMRKQSNRWQRPPASRCSPVSGEVGRKFRDLIQDEKVERRDRQDMEWQDDARVAFTRRWLRRLLRTVRHRRALMWKETRKFSQFPNNDLLESDTLKIWISELKDSERFFFFFIKI